MKGRESFGKLGTAALTTQDLIPEDLNPQVLVSCNVIFFHKLSE